MTAPAAPSDASVAHDVGVIELGTTGRPMATHLARGRAPGSTVHLTGRTDVGRRPRRAGARWHASARSLGASCGVVVMMVPDLPDVRSVLDGPDGPLAGIASPTVPVITTAHGFGDQGTGVVQTCLESRSLARDA